jgi:hypothetical protein
MSLKDLKPAVSKYWLLMLAGLMWSAVGILLCRRAYGWFTGIGGSGSIPLELVSLLLALTVYRFGFSKVAERNIRRLCLLTEGTCLFAFQTWKGYLIIGSMIALGYVLRHSPVPRPYLAIAYMTIGGALFLSSFRYYRLLWQRVIGKDPCSGERV